MYNKYYAQKMVVDGIRFDSKAEARRYGELKVLEKVGDIEGLSLQPKFTLQEAFKQGKTTIRAIEYRGDFQYYEKKSGRWVVEDVKGMATKEFGIKRKLFLKRYGEEYDFRIVR